MANDIVFLSMTLIHLLMKNLYVPLTGQLCLERRAEVLPLLQLRRLAMPARATAGNQCRPEDFCVELADVLRLQAAGD